MPAEQPRGGSAGTPPTPPILTRNHRLLRHRPGHVFLRHTLGASRRLPAPASATWSRSPTRPCRAKSRASDRNQINKNLRSGYELSSCRARRRAPPQRAGFLAAYEQTMRRTGAAERYFFGAAYFDRILESPRTWLALADAPGRRRSPPPRSPPRSDGYLHYYLSGSADSHLRDSPMKNVVAALVELAAELGAAAQPRRRHHPRRPPRGVQARLRQPRASPGARSELVCDPAAYARLSAGRDAGGLLPRLPAPS